MSMKAKEKNAETSTCVIPLYDILQRTIPLYRNLSDNISASIVKATDGRLVSIIDVKEADTIYNIIKKTNTACHIVPGWKSC